MKRRNTLLLKNKLKATLRQRLVRRAAGILVIGVLAGLVWFNLFSAGESRANLLEDGEEVMPLELTSICSENPDVMRRWRISNTNSFAVPVEWDVYPYFQTGLIIAHPGESYFYSNTLPGQNTVRIRWQDANTHWQQTMTASTGSPCGPSGCYAAEVISYNPTKRNDGSNVPEERRNAARALGAPEGDASLNFVSLGFGGEITLKFASPVANGEGNDLRIKESTAANQNCTRYPEKIQAFGSQDGCHYIYLGEACQDAEFDFGVMSWVQYIKLRDISPLSHPYGNAPADGYDVDGIECLNGAAQNPGDDQLVSGSAQEIIQYNQGTRKNGTPIHPTRTNPEQAIGIPQGDDMGINFVALGFTGYITVKFDYVVFNKPGNDLQIVETSFGQQNCSSYHEAAYVEGSLDGVNWVAIGEVCLDAELDLGDDVAAIQFLRITDRSPASEFPNSADGYDIDGIIVLSSDCIGQQRITPFDNNSIPDEIAEIQFAPNPFKDQFNLIYETGSVDERVNLKMFNYVGQLVHQEVISIPKNTKANHPVNGSNLTKGVYIVTLESSGQKQSVKLIKN